MKKLILPLLLSLFGLGTGLAAGFLLAPAKPAGEAPVTGAASAEPEHPPDYAKIAEPFIVPVLEKGRVASVIILSLSLEITAGTPETVTPREPKLRDAFLRVLLEHANAGGFRGSFTDISSLEPLRRALLEAARQVLPDITVSDVLITDIGRQDT